METVNYISREHARAPMPWSAAPQGGFTTGAPWIPLHPDYPFLNAEAQQADPDSVYHYYRKLLALRKSSMALLYGHYALQLPNSQQVYAYTRTLNGEQALVLCNFSGETAPCPLLRGRTEYPPALANYAGGPAGEALRPWECVVYLQQTGQSL